MKKHVYILPETETSYTILYHYNKADKRIRVFTYQASEIRIEEIDGFFSLEVFDAVARLDKPENPVEFWASISGRQRSMNRVTMLVALDALEQNFWFRLPETGDKTLETMLRKNMQGTPTQNDRAIQLIYDELPEQDQCIDTLDLEIKYLPENYEEDVLKPIKERLRDRLRAGLGRPTHGATGQNSTRPTGNALVVDHLGVRPESG